MVETWQLRRTSCGDDEDGEDGTERLSAIADLVSFLLSTGIPPESISVAVDLAIKHGIEQVEIMRNSAEIPRNSVESSEEKRKRKDRERKRKSSENSAESAETPLLLTSSLPSEEILKKERKKESSGIRARARKKLGPLPENWQPPDNAYALAIEYGTTVPSVEAIFRDYLKSSGKLYADHDAAFCNFVRNQRKFNGNGTSKTGGSLIASIDRELAELRSEERTDFKLPEGNIRRLSHGPIR